MERAKNYLRRAVSKDYVTSRKAHVDFFKQYMDRVSLDLGIDKYAGVTTDMRVQNFKETKDDFLVATYFRFGRYLLICSSQPGGSLLICKAFGMINYFLPGIVNILVISIWK